VSLAFYDQSVPFENSACWLDPPAVVSAVTRGASKGKQVPRVTDGRRRRDNDWSSGLVLHTTSGTVRRKLPGFVESMRDWAYARYQTSTDREVSWHLTLDLDGSALQQAGPEWLCWHAGAVNGFADGWECVQTANGELTEVQLARLVELVDTWAWHTGIPRAIPWRDGQPFRGMITRCLAAHGAGRTVCCVYGHRNVWSLKRDVGPDGKPRERLVPQRGAGDPSDLPFLALEAAGYRKMDVEAGEDLAEIERLQTILSAQPDKVWGPASRAAAWVRDPSSYVWVARPGDDQRGTPAWLRARSAQWRTEHGVSLAA
jgi:hypothetical protein